VRKRYRPSYISLSIVFLLLGSVISLGLILANDDSPVFGAADPISAVGETKSAQIATMPMTSDMASGINNLDNVNTNPGLNTVTETPGDSNVPITSGADSNNQFQNPGNTVIDGRTPTDNNQVINTKPELNEAISPSGNSIVPATSSVDPNRVANSENTDINTGQSLNKATSSLDPTSLNKEDILQLKHKLQELIKGDKECNSLYDDTIITWKNIVDRTKSIIEDFGLAEGLSDIPPPRPAGTDIDIILKSLDITKTTDIDKRDHTTIEGTDDKDYIVGSPEDDLICAKDGNDVVFSDAGVDAIFAQGGMDTVQGGIGNNQIFGGSEGDTLVGGIDDDLIAGRAGDDRLFGADGNDVLEGDKGADYFNCGDGIDIVLDFNPTEGDIITIDCETS
jgi:Ca2+-binding RTX toxin-like protein